MINGVRNTVLSVLNKNNYGYISPSDFNLFALNAQMEIFEEYFSSYNKVINAENARMSGTDYADIEAPIAEVMEFFIKKKQLSQVAASTNEYYLPSLLTTGSEAYMINKITCFDPTTSAKLGEAEKVSQGKIDLLIDSPLTSPSSKYPSYILSENKITIYPSLINGANSVICTYFTYPLAPKWTYITLANGEPVFDQSQIDYQDFQLPQEEEYKLVTKILQYAGISIRETEVASYAIGQEQQQQTSFSPQ
tara:strand:- start:2169 stop:2918 length:750 start_codon:yes stop_codon:yes gene_type:complete